MKGMFRIEAANFPAFIVTGGNGNDLLAEVATPVTQGKAFCPLSQT